MRRYTGPCAVKGSRKPRSMTRIAVLADIHGNYPALQAVIADMDHTRPDHVVVAGDIINGVPLSREVLETVHAQRWTLLRGNHEFYLLNHRTEHGNPDLAASMDLLEEQIDGWYAFIAALPDETTLHYRDGPPVRISHGTPGDNRSAISLITSDEEADRLLHGVPAPVYVHGHYHIGYVRQVNGRTVVNPGPVGMPGDGLRRAGYALLESDGTRWHVTLRRVDYDFAPVEDAFARWQVEDRLGYKGRLWLEQFRTARNTINNFFRWLEANHPDAEPSMDLVTRYLAQPPEVIWHSFGPAYRINRELLG